MPLEVTLSNEEKVKVTAAPRTAAGNPASLDGPLRALVVSGDGTVESDSDPLSIWLVSGSTPGMSTFLIEGDADLGAGVVLIQDTATLNVVGALAVALGLVASSPVPK